MLPAALRSLLSCTPLLFFSSRRRHTRSLCDWSSDVCSSDLTLPRRRLRIHRPICLLSLIWTAPWSTLVPNSSVASQYCSQVQDSPAAHRTSVALRDRKSVV